MNNSQKEMPLWFSLLMIAVMISAIILMINTGSRKVSEEKKQYLRNSFSRMSDDSEIQEAYLFEGDTLAIETP